MKKNLLLVVSMVLSFGVFASVPKTNNHGLVIETKKAESVVRQAKVAEEKSVVDKKKSKPAVKKEVTKKCPLEIAVETCIDENIKVTAPTKETRKKASKNELKTKESGFPKSYLFLLIGLFVFLGGVLIIMFAA